MEATGGTSEDAVAVPRPPAPSLTVAAVARRLGVAPPTLRTWDRRYGLGPSAHTAGAHRRYSPEDVARLMVMRRLTLEGVPPAEAARYALATSDTSERTALASITAIGGRLPRAHPARPAGGASPAPSPESDEERSGGPAGRPAPARWDGLLDPEIEDLDDRFAEADLDALVRAGVAEREEQPGPEPDGLDAPWRDEPGEEVETPWLGVLRSGTTDAGDRRRAGRVVALPTGTPATRSLARAAMSLDTHATASLLRAAMRRGGLVATWEDLVRPVLHALGERSGATGDGIDVEHAFSEVLLAVLRDFAPRTRPAGSVPPVVLACAEDDYHSIPLHVLHVALGERHVESRLLGIGLPSYALAAAVRRIGPLAVVVYAHLPGADARVVEELRRQTPAPQIILGGPGWDPDTVPESARTATGLGEALHEVMACLPA